MGIFRQLLAKRQSDQSGRRWLFVPYDQLSDSIGPLSQEDPVNLGIILVENTWKAARRPYHKQKLGLILTNLRYTQVSRKINEVQAGASHVRSLGSGLGVTLIRSPARFQIPGIVQLIRRQISCFSSPLVQ